MNAEQLLRDPNIQPTDEVLTAAMGASYTAWQTLMEKLADLGIALEWRYYNDGKSWLGKCVYKKKTVFWASVWDGFFKTTLYFTEKTRAGIQDLPIDESIKAAIANGTPIGRLIPLLLEVRDERQLPDVVALIDYKRKLK